MKINMPFKKETKNCYCFEASNQSGDSTTLYLKKHDVISAGIDPRKGIVVTVKEGTSNE